MSARPILFRGDMVRAILAGAKTQTRRQITPSRSRMSPVNNLWEDLDWSDARSDGPRLLVGFERVYSRIEVGDLLWVRETFGRPDAEWHPTIEYRADYGPDYDRLWTPSIFMRPTESRLTLRVTEVRAQRLTEISPADVLAEGFAHAGLGTTPTDYAKGFRTINKLPPEADPWVWAYTFERV